MNHEAYASSVVDLLSDLYIDQEMHLSRSSHNQSSGISNVSETDSPESVYTQWVISMTFSVGIATFTTYVIVALSYFGWKKKLGFRGTFIGKSTARRSCSSPGKAFPQQLAYLFCKGCIL